MIQKIVSGGQTGVDRAALDVARRHGISHGGWCPRGRRAEDGSIPLEYDLSETPSGDYAQRTEWNVRDSDGTLIVTRGRSSEGTEFTVECAKKYDRLLLIVDLSEGTPDMSDVSQWIADHEIQVLNVAGPRASEVPGIYEEAAAVLADYIFR